MSVGLSSHSREKETSPFPLISVSPFLIRMPLFPKDPLNQRLKLGSRGHWLGGVSSQAFSEGNFYENKKENKD